MVDELDTALRKRATIWAGKITKLAKAYASPVPKIKITTKTLKLGDGRYGVQTTAVARDAYGNDFAVAYEYGSGIHARRKSRRSRHQLPDGRILIRPKFAGALVFPWDVASANPEAFSMLDGKVVLPEVKHPGVKALNGGKGYIGPAYTEVRKQARKELGSDGLKAIHATIRKEFSQMNNLSINTAIAAIISYLKADAPLVALLTNDDTSIEIREMQWKGTDFKYPAVRVRMDMVVDVCPPHDLNITISSYSENKSSKEANNIIEKVCDALHEKTFSRTIDGVLVKFSSVRVQQIHHAESTEEDQTWTATVDIKAKVN